MCTFLGIYSLSRNSGKTVTSFQLAKKLIEFGKKVLLIDLDSNLGLSDFFESFNNRDFLTVSDLFSETINANTKVIYQGENRFKFIGYDNVSTNEQNQYWIEEFRKSFDFVIFDMESTTMGLVEQIFKIIDKVLVPVECEFYGFDELKNTLMHIIKSQKVNSNLLIEGILLNRVKVDNLISESITANLREILKELMFDVVIPRTYNLALRNSKDQDISINNIDENQYRLLAKNIIENTLI